MPEYREGDTVWPGRPVADVIESGRMEVRAKIDENDRANLTEGQDATVEVDALPGQTLHGQGRRAVRASRSRGGFFESSGVTRQFDVTFQFVKPDPRMKAGASAQRHDRRQGRRRTRCTVPRQAVFEKNGKTYVFVKTGDRFERARGQGRQPHREPRRDRRALPEGTEIALVDPDVATPGAGQSRRRSPLPEPRDERRRAGGTPSEAAAGSPLGRTPTSCPSCGSASRTCAPTSCARC